VTTLVISNVPRKYNQQAFATEISHTSFKGSYDFLYLPKESTSRLCQGYAIMNFVDEGSAWLFTLSYAGRKMNRFEAEEPIDVVPAAKQGYAALLEQYGDWQFLGSCSPAHQPMFLRDSEEELCKPRIPSNLGVAHAVRTSRDAEEGLYKPRGPSHLGGVSAGWVSRDAEEGLYKPRGPSNLGGVSARRISRDMARCPAKLMTPPRLNCIPNDEQMLARILGIPQTRHAGHKEPRQMAVRGAAMAAEQPWPSTHTTFMRPSTPKFCVFCGRGIQPCFTFCPGCGKATPEL